MNGILDALLVGFALLASVLYAFVALGPRPWRQRAGAALAACGLPRVAQWIRPAGAADGSGSCGGCGDCAAPNERTPGAGGETHVPLDGIARRKT